jgi:hypothetical protein
MRTQSLNLQRFAKTLEALAPTVFARTWNPREIPWRVFLVHSLPRGKE